MVKSFIVFVSFELLNRVLDKIFLVALLTICLKYITQAFDKKKCLRNVTESHKSFIKKGNIYVLSYFVMQQITNQFHLYNITQLIQSGELK